MSNLTTTEDPSKTSGLREDKAPISVIFVIDGAYVQNLEKTLGLRINLAELARRVVGSDRLVEIYLLSEFDRDPFTEERNRVYLTKLNYRGISTVRYASARLFSGIPGLAGGYIDSFDGNLWKILTDNGLFDNEPLPEKPYFDTLIVMSDRPSLAKLLNLVESYFNKEIEIVGQASKLPLELISSQCDEEGRTIWDLDDKEFLNPILNRFQPESNTQIPNYSGTNIITKPQALCFAS